MIIFNLYPIFVTFFMGFQLQFSFVSFHLLLYTSWATVLNYYTKSFTKAIARDSFYDIVFRWQIKFLKSNEKIIPIFSFFCFNPIYIDSKT